MRCWVFRLKLLWVITLLVCLLPDSAPLAAQPAEPRKPVPVVKGKTAKPSTGKPFVIQETYRETLPAEDEIDPGKGIVGLDMRIEPNQYPVIQGVFKGTPAYTKGIRIGDTILAINGVRVVNKSLWEVDTLISDVPGEVVTLVILRDGKPRKISLTVMSLHEANATVQNSFAGMIP